jgi:molecular chaperone GrpE (heat shock protein)
MDKNDKKYPEPIVGALIINKEGKILLAKSKKWVGQYTIFGGHVEMGETLEEAVKREVKEEAGIDVEVQEKLSFMDSIFDKNFHEKKHFVFIDYLCWFDGDDKDIKLNGEFDEKDFIWATPKEALELKIPEGTKRIIEGYLESKEQKKYFDSWKRCAADFENYKKRQAENQKDLIAYSNINLILEILPVLDNFYASTEHVPEDQKESPWVVGIMHIQKQLEKILEDNGVSEVVVKAGDKFNPEIHEAIENKENKSKDLKNIVKKILIKGYKMGDRVIRAARVIVE